MNCFARQNGLHAISPKNSLRTQTSPRNINPKIRVRSRVSKPFLCGGIYLFIVSHKCQGAVSSSSPGKAGLDCYDWMAVFTGTYCNGHKESDFESNIDAQFPGTSIHVPRVGSPMSNALYSSGIFLPFCFENVLVPL